jgi:hypothetical protein
LAKTFKKHVNVRIDGFAKKRHSGENRPPQADREFIIIRKAWIPAFAERQKGLFPDFLRDRQDWARPTVASLVLLL